MEEGESNVDRGESVIPGIGFQDAPSCVSWRRLSLLTVAIGPGIITMLADTDAGSIVTAAQSGAMWGYQMVLPQMILIPILYLVQEVTVRLGIVTKQGHGELIRGHFGFWWAILSVSTLFLSSVGALVTEFSGIAGVGALFGVPVWFSVPAATILLIALGITGSYLYVERVGIVIGLFELAFVVTAFMVHPSPAQMVHDVVSLPLGNAGYTFLLAANVGAVIMPWMIFYQQGAVTDKHLTRADLRAARWETLIGSIITQAIMIAVVIAVAATIGQVSPHRPLNTVQEISQALAPFIGPAGGKVLFGLGMLGASFTASLVVSIAGAYGIGEAFHFNHSLNHRFSEARLFYLIYTLAHVGGALIVLLNVDHLIDINVDVEVMNAMLLPIVLGFLLALEAKVLPKQWRMQGVYRYVVWGLSGVVMAFGLYVAVKVA
ncbi:MAG: divalent metal cation transporter [Chloroflexi bacterium]|nr:divalent metal cation transporter [Chloroflexota bacterium]